MPKTSIMYTALPYQTQTYTIKMIREKPFPRINNKKEANSFYWWNYPVFTQYYPIRLKQIDLCWWIQHRYIDKIINYLNT